MHIPRLKVIQIQKDIQDVFVALSSGLSPVSTVPPGTKDPVLWAVTDEKLTCCDPDPTVKAESSGSRSAVTEDRWSIESRAHCAPRVLRTWLTVQVSPLSPALCASFQVQDLKGM